MQKIIFRLIRHRLSFALTVLLSILILTGIPVRFLVFANNNHSNTESPNRFCQLEITKTPTSQTVVAGGEVNFNISFKNTGTADCTGGGVHLMDTLDSRLTFVSQTHTSNTDDGYGEYESFDAGTRTLHWNAHELTPGESGSVNLKVKASESVSCGETIVTNKAKITALELNNFSTWVQSNLAQVTITKTCEPTPTPTPTPAPTSTPTPTPTPTPTAGGEALLSIQKTGPVSTHRSETYSYKITVKNIGTAVADNVVVRDSIPESLIYMKADGGNCSLSVNILSCQIDDLPAGQSQILNVEVKVSDSAVCHSLIRNRASVQATLVSLMESNEVVTEVECASTGGGGAVYNNVVLTLQKQVRNVSQGGNFADLVNATSGDVLEYKVTVHNTGSLPASNLELKDAPSNASFVTNFRDLSASSSFTGSLNSSVSSMKIGSLSVGQISTILYKYTLATNLPAGFETCNIITLTGDYVSSQSDQACVRGITQTAGSNVFLNFSKKAFNDTQNMNAILKPARGEDYITYTLQVGNSGNSPATGFVIQDDLAGVLSLADVVDFGGGSLTGSVLSFPATNVPAGGVVQKQFKVRVKAFLPNLSYIMRNTYGNTVDVAVNRRLEPVVAPSTGGFSSLIGAGGLGSLSVLGLFMYRRRKS